MLRSLEWLAIFLLLNRDFDVGTQHLDLRQTDLGPGGSGKPDFDGVNLVVRARRHICPIHGGRGWGRAVPARFGAERTRRIEGMHPVLPVVRDVVGVHIQGLKDHRAEIDLLPCRRGRDHRPGKVDELVGIDVVCGKVLEADLS